MLKLVSYSKKTKKLSRRNVLNGWRNMPNDMMTFKFQMLDEFNNFKNFSF